jgi:hypothetical protein
MAGFAAVRADINANPAAARRPPVPPMKIRVPPARTLRGVSSYLYRQQEMGLDVAARLFDVEFRQGRIVRTGAGDQHVVDRRGQLVEEPSEPFEVGGVEGRAAQGADFAGGTLEALRVPGGENYVRPLSACSSGRFEPDAGATADDEDGLPKQFRFARAGRSAGWGAHDSSDRQSKLCCL